MDSGNFYKSFKSKIELNQEALSKTGQALSTFLLPLCLFNSCFTLHPNSQCI